MLFRFLNLSPPCAMSASRASSSGVVAAVMAGGAAIVLVATAVPLDFVAPGPWAITAALNRSKTSVGVYFFMAGVLPRNKIETGSLSYTPRRGEGSEI